MRPNPPPWMPILMPRLSDRAAVQLTEFLHLIVGIVQHHYGPQVQRWHRRRRRAHTETSYPSQADLYDDSPF